ncbi:MAG: hypothetical protein KBS81_02540 [Spirochaetales bacterium]|nr:hypothetical protein [Candidatus Physcosoma equi]
MKDGRILSDTERSPLTEEVLSSLYGVEVSRCTKCGSISVKSGSKQQEEEKKDKS